MNDINHAYFNDISKPNYNIEILKKHDTVSLIEIPNKAIKNKIKQKFARVKARVSHFYFDLTRLTTGGLTFFSIL